MSAALDDCGRGEHPGDPLRERGGVWELDRVDRDQLAADRERLPLADARRCRDLDGRLVVVVHGMPRGAGGESRLQHIGRCRDVHLENA